MTAPYEVKFAIGDRVINSGKNKGAPIQKGIIVAILDPGAWALLAPTCANGDLSNWDKVDEAWRHKPLYAMAGETRDGIKVCHGNSMRAKMVWMIQGDLKPLWDSVPCAES